MIIALDVGASNIRSAIVNGSDLKEKKVLKTPQKKEQIKNAIFSLIESYPKPSCICIGVASFIRNGKTKNTQNMDFSDINLIELIKRRYNVPVFVDNDAKCAGLAELVYGFGKGKKNFILLTLGTGIGGAIIINGKLFRGTGYAGEPGHMLINEERFERLASAPGTARLAKKYGFKKISTYVLRKLADKGNKQAIKTFKESGKYLGIGLLNLAYMFDPEIIILGGGFSNVSLVLQEARRFLKDNDRIKRNIPVVRAKLGDDAGLIGAALLSKEKIN